MTRNEKGQFVKGHGPVGAGRKPREVEASYLRSMQKAVTEDDWIEIVTKAVTQAKRGDNAARKWLSDYLLGTPVNRTEITGAEGSAMEIIVRYVD